MDGRYRNGGASRALSRRRGQFSSQRPAFWPTRQQLRRARNLAAEPITYVRKRANRRLRAAFPPQARFLATTACLRAFSGLISGARLALDWPRGLSHPHRDATSERHGPRRPGAALPQRMRVGVRAMRARRRRHADHRRTERRRGDPDSSGEPRGPPAHAHAKDRLTVPLTAVLPTAARALAVPRGRRNSTLPPRVARGVFFATAAAAARVVAVGELCMRFGARLRLQRFPLAALRFFHLVEREVEPRPRLHRMPPGAPEQIAAVPEQVSPLQRR